MKYCFAADTDSYKYTHGPQLPENLGYATSYMEARTDDTFTHSMVVGEQAKIKKVIESPLTMAEVDDLNDLITMHCGYFPYDEFKRVVNVHGGLPPVRIQVLPEGLVVPNRIPHYQITTEDPELPTIGQFMETNFLRAWAPSAVGTLSWYIKQDLRQFLERTCADPAAVLPFMLHDFGGRGATSEESAAIDGMAHLVNFMGTDTVPALLAARRYYGERCAGFSIPAMEHFTVTCWGQDREADAYANMIEKFGGEGRVYACVSDAYDIYNAVDNIWGKQLKQKVLDKGGRVVIRPDSGDPTSVVLYCVRSLAKSFGYTVNSKGFKVLHPSVRVIQGDGVNRESIRSILTALELDGFSAENVAFGMGGALHQSMTRDTLGNAQKANAITSGHSGWIGISKNPVTARQKVSKKGRQMVYQDADGEYHSVLEGSVIADNLLQTVYENKALVRDMAFSQLRANSELPVSEMLAV
jgi:nicotinamide phosphoribosyltransferase